MPIDNPLVIYDAYDLRSLIENCLFRELKQGWNLLAFPKKTEDAVRSHVYLSILTFNLANAYRSKQGQDLAEQGIRRQRLVGRTRTRCWLSLVNTTPSSTSKNCSSCGAVSLRYVGALILKE